MARGSRNGSKPEHRPMRLWSARFPGGWYGGSAAVLAPDQATARALLAPRMEDAGFRGQIESIEMDEVALDAAVVVTFETGDT